jgi:hypothetical protein
MSIDPNNPVVALCAAGMAVEGDAEAARHAAANIATTEIART